MITTDPLAFAQRLGRHSAAYVGEAEVLAGIRAAILGGRQPTDAVLAAVKQRATVDRAVEDEFAAYVLPIAMQAAHESLRHESWLKGHLETSDLAASVFRQLWPQLTEVEFETEARFCALLAARMRRRLVDHARWLTAGKRQEDRRADQPPEDLAVDPMVSGPGPDEQAMRSERDASFQQALGHLPERQRHVLELFVYQQMDRKAIARTLGISYEAARAALQRAVAHISRILGDDG